MCHRPSRLGVLAAALALSMAVTGCESERPSEPTATAPQLVLWAWERPEDVRFLEGGATKVAYLHATVRLGATSAEVVPRRQPLLVADDTPLVGVIRVELLPGERAVLDAGQRTSILDAFRDLASDDRIEAVQIDFDAPISIRDRYVALLWELDDVLPSGIDLSMTALASWCAGDDWLSRVPLPDLQVVPMVFDMGPESETILSRLASGPFGPPRCQKSIGLRAGDAWPKLRTPDEVWLFSDGPWTLDAYDASVSRLSP